MLKNLIFAILTIFAVSTHAEDLKIKVGGVLALSGLASPHGKSIQEGMLLAQEDLKKENIDIQFTFEDDNTQTSKTIAAIQSLSARGIKFIIGPTWSYQVASALKILEKSKILAFAPACSSEFSGGAHPNVIYGTLKTSEKMKPTTEWIKSNNIKKVMILRDNAEWGTIHEAMFKEAAEIEKASILSTDTFNYGDEASAMQAFATKVRNTKPDAILMTSTKDAFSLLMKKLIEYKVKIKILSTQDAYDAKSSKLLPANFENVSVSYLSYPSSEKYAERFFTKYSKIPYIFSDATYDAVMMIGRAVRAKGENIQDLRNYILNDMRYDGLSGSVQFDSNGDVKKGAYQIVELTP